MQKNYYIVNAFIKNIKVSFEISIGLLFVILEIIFAL